MNDQNEIGRESAVAEALESHTLCRQGDGYDAGCFGCGWKPDAEWYDVMAHVTQHRAHVAAVILAALDTPPALGEDERAADTEWCRRCGGPNVIWSAASPLWNLVMRGNDINGETKFADLVCMPCFITLAVEAGLSTHGWRLTLVPEPEGLIYETPSGRVWDPERFLWVDPQPRYDPNECGNCGRCGHCSPPDADPARAHQSTPPEQAEAVAAAVRAAVETQVGYLELTAKQIREQGDVAQVLLSDEGVGQAPSLADELWVIAYNIRAALTPTERKP